VKNDVDVDKNDTITVPARERDLVRERKREIRARQGSNRQQQYVVGAFFLLSYRH